MDGIKSSFVKGITAINMKTNNFMEESKCKTYIATLDNEIKELKLRIGELAFDRWSNGQDFTQELQEYFQQIQQKMNEIQNQNEKIKQLELETRQVMGTASQAPAVVYCKSCGTQNPVTHKFCIKCGTKMS